MTGIPGRSALYPVDGGRQDAATRRREFEATHPEVVILAPAPTRWRAVVPPGRIPADDTATTLGAWDLSGLMDQLDELYPPGG